MNFSKFIASLILFFVVSVAAEAQDTLSLFYSISRPTLDTLEQRIYDSTLARVYVQNPEFKGNENPIDLLTAHYLHLSPLTTASYQATRSYIEMMDDSSFVWHGTIDTTGDVVISVSNEAIWGYIVVAADTIEFMSLSNNLCVAYSVDYSKFTGSDCSTVGDTTHGGGDSTGIIRHFGNQGANKIIKDKTDGNQLLTSCDGTRMNILFVYTNGVLQAKGNVQNICAMINGWVSDANQISINSMWNSSYELYSVAGIISTSFTESTDPSTTVYNLSNNSTIQTARNTYQADVVVLITNMGSWGGTYGIARTIGPSNNLSYCCVRYDSPGNRYTCAHEIGHLFGCLHSDDPSSSPFSYGHGYVLSNGEKTVMASAGNEGRIKYWSNPNVWHNGSVCGSTSWCNDARLHSEQSNTVASFRNPVTITSFNSPNTLNAGQSGTWSVNLCYGNSSGTTTYHWYTNVRGSNTWVSKGTASTMTTTMHANDCFITIKCVVNVGSDATVAYDYMDCGNCNCTPAVVHHNNNNDGDGATAGIRNDNGNFSGITLEQVAPNPVSEKTEFRFTIPSHQSVLLVVYDILGNEIKQLLADDLEKGSYTVSFDASGLPSAMYICSLNTNEGKVSKKFTVVH